MYKGQHTQPRGKSFEKDVCKGVRYLMPDREIREALQRLFSSVSCDEKPVFYAKRIVNGQTNDYTDIKDIGIRLMTREWERSPVKR